MPNDHDGPIGRIFRPRNWDRGRHRGDWPVFSAGSGRRGGVAIDVQSRCEQVRRECVRLPGGCDRFYEERGFHNGPAIAPALDGLIFAAGVALDRHFSLTDASALRRVLAVNVEGLLLLRDFFRVYCHQFPWTRDSKPVCCHLA